MLNLEKRITQKLFIKVRSVFLSQKQDLINRIRYISSLAIIKFSNLAFELSKHLMSKVYLKCIEESTLPILKKVSIFILHGRQSGKGRGRRPLWSNTKEGYICLSPTVF